MLCLSSACFIESVYHWLQADPSSNAGARNTNLLHARFMQEVMQGPITFKSNQFTQSPHSSSSRLAVEQLCTWVLWAVLGKVQATLKRRPMQMGHGSFGLPNPGCRNHSCTWPISTRTRTNIVSNCLVSCQSMVSDLSHTPPVSVSLFATRRGTLLARHGSKRH